MGKTLYTTTPIIAPGLAILVDAGLFVKSSKQAVLCINPISQYKALVKETNLPTLAYLNIGEDWQAVGDTQAVWIGMIRLHRITQQAVL